MRGHGSLAPGVAEEVVRRRRLKSISTNKASGGDGIPVELFQILKQLFISDSKEATNTIKLIKPCRSPTEEPPTGQRLDNLTVNNKIALDENLSNIFESMSLQGYIYTCTYTHICLD